MKLFTFLDNWMMMSTAADIFCFLKFDHLKSRFVV